MRYDASNISFDGILRKEILMTLLDVKHVQKIYKTRFQGNQVEALKDIHFTVEKGDYVAIMGESGSGKSTLLNILAMLDKPTRGQVYLNGTDTATIKNSQASSFRREKLGFVFQDFNLLDQFNNRDNIFLPLVLSNEKEAVMKDRLSKLKSALGIGELLEKYPYEVSGGQKQRIAVARGVITNPALLLADEPTGALHSQSSESLLKMFCKINEAGQTIIMVTHSLRASSYAKRVLFIKDGIVYHEIYRGENERQEAFMERINQAQFMLNRGDN